MKQKLSISIEENLVVIVENMLKKPEFRNKSHIVEVALNEFIKNMQEEI